MKSTDPPVAPGRLTCWVLAARPKTLAASIIPVVVGACLAGVEGKFMFVPALLCLMFAVCAQIAANFANDYCDFKNGVDTCDRLGPDRAVVSGWISPRAMAVAALLALTVACAFGLCLIPYGGWQLVWIGVVVVVFCLLYSAGPIPLAYIGLGDVAVILFFGIVATGVTGYIQCGYWTREMTLIGLAVGLVADNILIANNYRDRNTDRIHKKYTLVVLLGERFGRMFYLVNGLIATSLTMHYFVLYDFPRVSPFLLGLYLYFHLRSWYLLLRLDGKRLNIVLEQSAKNLLLYGCMFVIASILPR